ncbi:MAG: T9SS type A sorting domain-containing protein, partial [Ignavibacteriota bacterium]
DDGVTWNPAMNGLPYVHVTELRVRGANGNRLLAGTYGRGMFWLDLTTLGTKTTPTVSENLKLEPTYPNPISSGNATVGFSLKNPGLATLSLHDVLGRELRILDKSYYSAGKHEAALNLAGIASGTYFILLTGNGNSVSEKIVIN